MAFVGAGRRRAHRSSCVGDRSPAAPPSDLTARGRRAPRSGHRSAREHRGLRTWTTTARISSMVDTINRGVRRSSPPSIRRPRAAVRSEVQLAVPDVHRVTDWYAPAAVVLMLQQFGVAFGALSFVRERRLGIVDVFRVAPVNATATLIGKYFAYIADRRRDRRRADGARRRRARRAGGGERRQRSRS